MAKELSDDELVSLFWAALEEVVKKNAGQKALRPGRHRVELDLTGWIDGKVQTVRRRLACVLTVDTELDALSSRCFDDVASAGD